MIGRNACCLLLVLALAGCATYTHNALAIRSNLAGSNYEGALRSVSSARKGPARLLYLLENGLVAHYRGEYVLSNRYFEEAERLADRLFTRSLSREAVSLITNDAVRNYRGEEFELVFIHYYRALNYWYLGLPEDALVECRKANLKLAGYAAQADYDATYKNDAFIHYLTGLFYEATGELNDAYVSYRDAAKAYETYSSAFGLRPPEALEGDLDRIEQALDGSEGVLLRLASASPGQGELILFSEIGFVPQKVQEEINLPVYENDIERARKGGLGTLSRQIAYRHSTPYYAGHGKVKYWLRVAFPIYREVAPSTREVTLTAAGRTARSTPAENLAAIAWQTFKDKQPAVLARTVARGLAKYTATEKVKKKNKVLGFFVNLFAAATEAADTRSWVSLPHSIHIGRLNLPAGVHTLTVQALDAQGRTVETRTFAGVRIHPGARTFVNVRTYR